MWFERFANADKLKKLGSPSAFDWLAELPFKRVIFGELEHLGFSNVVDPTVTNAEPNGLMAKS
ncbi:hypothetical protein A6456_33010 [Paraburkholderia tropica]|nr:hypothetical protein A6456_33010 [Paraburkholderia tropica]